ncbi:beta-lactamase family protein [Paenibacillus sp. 19GGS1-52]|uniref:serine hydrolase domain-containing protein n=1 Tax=Paenibacillus sp. 19GGS1-52 TaxID=2758563 RepID=UPI001EFC0EF2|nr:serine hydrolase domain-containing protein [Paenibacillus sp. 19GGS1-52]ULO09892.1 beta-lactamase family protein [Paenibacillus sp. 19GGS1-52]
MSSSMRRIFCTKILLALLVATVGASLLGAQTPASAALPPSTLLSTKPEGPAAGLDDLAQLSAFIDGIMEGHMDNFKIPGAVISIVKDGKILLSKGYGHSNVEEATLVDPETSLFRIASVTKLFTWTAVMQLVEQGKIDLDTDVNTYLKTVIIPKTYPQPITMRHLMTHTAGFEEGGVGYQITTDPKKLPVSISETLAKHMPARVMPPGEMMSYSNYGASLAGLIVEEVSGIAYNDYIQKNIFDPLDMKYATVQEPVPASLEPYAVLGYARENGQFATRPPTFEGGFRPAGSGSVSADDMAHFMIAHLQDGRYGNQQILEPKTAQLMHSPAFVFNKHLPAMDLGFSELNMNGLRVISHGGSDELFNTEVYLVPDKQIGIFVSYSGGDGGAAATGLAKAFFDRYFPQQEVNQSPAYAVLENSLQKYAGSYQFTRRNHSDVDKFFNFLVKLNITVSDNRLSIGSGADQQVYAPIGLDLFQEVGGTNKMGFRTDASGKVTYLFLDVLNPMPLEPTPLIDQPKFWLPLLGISAVLFITVLTGFAYRRREINEMPKVQRWAVRVSVATAAWALMTSVATFVVVLNMGLIDRLSRITQSLNLYLFMPIILVGLTVAILALSVMAWEKKYWTVLKRVHYTLVALSAVVMSLFFYHWNLLGWHFG